MNKATLGLAMICGSGEAHLLERCLKSARRDLEGELKLFDQVVVGVNYTETLDEEVLSVANKYADKVVTFKWEENFAKARNISFDACEGVEHICWLDADDIIKPESYKKLLELKPFLVNYEIVLMPYNYAHYSATGEPSVVLPRERIVRKSPEIRWEHPIHEAMNIQQLDPKKPPFRIKESDISIDHYKTKPNDPSRNLRILEREYNKPNCHGRMKFYYGKDLSEVGEWDKAIPILEGVVNNREDHQDNLAVACVKIARYYIERGRLDLAKNYSYKGIGFSGKYAEFFCTLGDIFKHDGDVDTAIKYYEEALKKKLDAGMSQMPEFYKYLPSDHLSVIYYYDKKDLEKALHYNTLTLECFPGDERILRNRELILNDLKAKDVVLSEATIKEIETFVSNKGLDFELVHNFSKYADIKLHRQEQSPEPIVRWMIPVVDYNGPSVRIRRLNVNNKMKEMGIDSDIISNYYPQPIEKILGMLEKANVVIFTQFGDYDFELMKRLKIQGKKLCFDHAEGIFNYPLEAECMNEADVVVCVSNKLAEMTQEHGHKNTAVIPDGIEEDRLNRVKNGY